MVRVPVWLAVGSTVVLTSATMLAFQVLQVIVLSLQLFPEAAFLVVSLSMLGLAAGGSIATALARRSPSADPSPRLWWCTVGFAAAILTAMLATSRLHGIPQLILVNVLPYLFVGLFLATVFAAAPRLAPQLYGADLLGAGIGCAAIVPALDAVGDVGLLTIVLAGVAAAAAVCIATSTWQRATAAALIAALALAVDARTDGWFPFGPDPDKLYGRLLAHGRDGATVERSRWNHLGRLDAVVPGPALAEFEFARQAQPLFDAGCAFHLLFSNGYNWTFTVGCEDQRAARDRVFAGWVQNAPYLFTSTPDVLNLGSGGGVDAFLALAHGARRVTAVEINPLMIEAATRWYGNDWDGMWRRPDVAVREIDARTFVSAPDEHYDVVTLNAVDTGASQASLFAVSFLYTTEAFSQYLATLRPGGVVFLTRPRDQLLRALAAAVAALRARRTPAPERHVVVFGSGELLSAAVYVDPLDDAHVARVRQAVAAGDFGGALQYAPGTTDVANPFDAYFAAVREHTEAEHARRSPTLLEPSTDDRPYFYQVERGFVGTRAGRLLSFILLWVTSIGATLIFAPLLRLEAPEKNRMIAGNLVYFGCLGVGFMLVEIALVHQLSLLLGTAASALTVTLAGMLMFGGLGSLLAGRFAGNSDRIPLVLLAAVVVCLAYAWSAGAMATVRLETLPMRIAATLAFLAPGSMILGMPFPLKLRTQPDGGAPFVPWAWATNGLASVIGSVLAVAAAMAFGFRAVLVLAATTYATALAAHLLTRVAADSTGKPDRSCSIEPSGRGGCTSGSSDSRKSHSG
jgi:spermidine synthase